MNERKEVPPVPAKPEVPRPAPPAAKATTQPAASPPAAPAKLIPAAAAGFGHGGTVFRPVSAQGGAPAAPPRPQAVASAPKPVAAQAKPVSPAPAAAPSPKPAAPAPAQAVAKPSKPAKAAAPKPFDPLAANAWFKAFGPNPWFRSYAKPLAYKEGLRAACEAGAILLRGVERLAQEIAVFAGEQMAQSAAAAEEFGNCRSFEALVAKQTSFARSNFDRATAAADKLAQMSVALAEEICEPLADEVDAAADRFIETLAR